MPRLNLVSLIRCGGGGFLGSPAVSLGREYLGDRDCAICIAQDLGTTALQGHLLEGELLFLKIKLSSIYRQCIPVHERLFVAALGKRDVIEIDREIVDPHLG